MSGRCGWQWQPGGTTILGPNGSASKEAHFPFDLFAGVRGTEAFPRRAAARTALLLLAEIQHSLHHRKILPELAAVTGAAGLLTPGSTTDAAFLPSCARRARSACSLTLTTKESLLEAGHLRFEHADLGLQFLGTLDGALMLRAVIVSLLTQSDYFGLQQPILLLERGMFLPQRTCLLFARLLGGHHACGATP